MNNLSSHFGSINARMSASDKDLPVKAPGDWSTVQKNLATLIRTFTPVHSVRLNWPQPTITNAMFRPIKKTKALFIASTVARPLKVEENTLGEFICLVTVGSHHLLAIKLLLIFCWFDPFLEYTIFPHIVSAETILFWIWKSKGHSI